MAIQKTIPLALVLLLCTKLLPPGASAQNTQTLGMNSASTDGITVSPAQRAAQTREDKKKIRESFSEALDAIRKNHIDGKALDHNHLFKSAITGMLRTLDPHSKYYDAKELDALKVQPRIGNVGIGVTIGERRLGGETGIFILASLQHSTAAAADLRFGDRITAVDNWDVKGHTVKEVREKLLGAAGSQVSLSIERAADNLSQTVAITRAVAPKPSVADAHMLRPGVGYIDLSQGFNLDATKELIDKVEKLRGEGMTSLVLDLRDNPGGFFDQAITVAERFLPEGQIILTQTSRKVGSPGLRYKSQNRTPYSSPLAVLVNHKTASGAEIVAGTLQDHDRALIVGEPTFGQSLVQSIIPLEYGSALAITTSKLILPSGRLIQRDYSQLGYYDYQARREPERNEAGAVKEQRRAEWKTDTGRSVYGGEGIVPDEVVERRALNNLQRRMIDPIFGFVRDLVNGRAGGFESYLVRRPVDFTSVAKPDEFAVKDDLFKAFKNFVAGTPRYNLTENELDSHREFIARQMRHDIITAAYGSIMAARVLRADDPQVQRAVEALPRAAQLATAPRNR